MRPYYSIKEPVETEFTEQKSRFICNAAPVKSAEEAMEFVRRCAQNFPGAHHNCYAYVITPSGSEQKMSDGHEPQGTAGMPILEVIKRKGLTDCVFVVSRYFGGIKLGANGLIGAYTRSAADAAEAATVVKFVESQEITVYVDYSSYKKAQEQVAESGEIAATEFERDVKITATVPKECTEALFSKLSELTSGRAACKIISEGYHSFPVKDNQ